MSNQLGRGEGGSIGFLSDCSNQIKTCKSHKPIKKEEEEEGRRKEKGEEKRKLKKAVLAVFMHQPKKTNALNILLLVSSRLVRVVVQPIRMTLVSDAGNYWKGVREARVHFI